MMHRTPFRLLDDNGVFEHGNSSDATVMHGYSLTLVRLCMFVGQAQIFSASAFARWSGHDTQPTLQASLPNVGFFATPR
jgi:hypothetical protein